VTARVEVDAEAASRSARGRSARSRGLTYERQFAGFLRATGWPNANRAIVTGWRAGGRSAADPGDITGTPGIIWSVKMRDGGLTDGEVAQFLDEAEQMAPIAWSPDAIGGPNMVFLVERRDRKRPEHWWIHARLSVLTRLYAGPFVSFEPVLGPAHARIRADMLIRLLHRYGYGDPS